MARRTTPRISEAVTEFIGQRMRRSDAPNFKRNYRSVLNRLTAFNKDCQVGSLTPAKLEDFFYGPAGLAAGGVLKSTLGAYRNQVKQFLAFCHRRGWHAHTAEFLLSGITEKSTQRRRAKRRLSQDELIAVIEGADNARDRALIAFIANTAVRISEALSPVVDDIRLDLGEMYLMIHKIDEEVTFPITEFLDRELRRWLAVYREEAGGQLQGSWRLFPPRWPNRTAAPKPGEKAVPVQRGGFNVTGQIADPADIIKRAAENAGVELGAGDAWHSIRRSAARLVFDEATERRAGDPMRMTQAFLNHKHMSTTEIYLDIEVERERLNRMLRGKDFLKPEGGNVVPLKRVEEA